MTEGLDTARHSIQAISKYIDRVESGQLMIKPDGFQSARRCRENHDRDDPLRVVSPDVPNTAVVLAGNAQGGIPIGAEDRMFKTTTCRPFVARALSLSLPS